MKDILKDKQCDRCEGQATLVCEMHYHLFCEQCMDEGDECPYCDPPYL